MRLIDLNSPEAVHLISNLEPKWKSMDEFSSEELINELNSIIESFMKLPVVEARPVKHGHWLGAQSFESQCPYTMGVCSICGCKPLRRVMSGMPYSYCPNCGAKMDEKINRKG